MLVVFVLKDSDSNLGGASFVNLNETSSINYYRSTLYYRSVLDDKAEYYNWEEDHTYENALNILKETIEEISGDTPGVVWEYKNSFDPFSKKLYITNCEKQSDGKSGVTFIQKFIDDLIAKCDFCIGKI